MADASPDLVAAIDRGDWSDKVTAAVARYVLRMAGRPAPFGRLAGVSVGEVGDRTHLEVDPALTLRERPVPAAGDGVHVNPTARRVGHRLHLIEPRTESWRAIDLTPEFDGAPQDALVDAGALVHDDPPVTGHGGASDSVRAAPGLSLARGVAEELRRGAELLCALTPDRPAPEIERFAERFADRWGDAEVPLLDALDPETGPGLQPENGDSPLFPVMLDAIARGDREWKLSDDDVAVLTPASPRPRPPAYAVLASLAEGGGRIFGVSGPSGARLVARHAASDARLRRLLEEHLRAEEALDPDALYAEVICCRPGGREAAVVSRPVLRENEIVVTGRGGGRELPLSELMVSVVDGRPVLRRRGRRVVPRLSSAHDFRASRNDVYRFLGLLQDESGTGWVTWRWGALRSAERLPRVRAGRLVLSPALWRIDDDVEAARERLDLPRWVVWVRDGRELPIDLDNPTAVAVLRRAARAGEITLAEMWPAPGRLCVRSPAGRYVHDVVVPFTGRAPVRREPRPASGRSVFVPGSDWSSVRLYCGPATADRILTDHVLPLLKSRRWFFLRYADPEWHLRVRLHGGAVEELVELGRTLHEAGLVWRVVLDTYVRESARYGDIEAAETAFHADSEAVCELLATRPTPAERFELATLGVAALLRTEGWEPGAIASLAHMHVNRILRSNHRAQEEAIYARLARQPVGAPAPVAHRER